MKEVIIEEKRFSDLKNIVLGTLMVAASIFIFFMGIEIVDIFFIVVGGVGSLFFGFIYIFILLKPLKKKPLVVLNSEGIIDNSSALGLKIRWDNIDGFHIYSQQIPFNTSPIDHLVVDVKSLEKLINNENYFKRKIIMINKKYYNAPVTINITTAKKSSEELLEIFRSYHERVKFNNV